MNMTIEYNGKYPNLCSGELKVTISNSEITRANKEWNFGHCLSSGGGINPNYEDTYSGPWNICSEYFPKDFPEELRAAVIEKVNEEIRHGCCGGCI